MRVAPKLTAPAAAPIAGQPPIKFHPERVVAIGASTGGVAAIQKVVASLGANSPPIVIAQHMPPGYTQRFAERLSKATAFDVREATDGLEIKPGASSSRRVAGISRSSRPSTVSRAGWMTDRSSQATNLRRCAVFRSMAKAVGKAGVGVILTGMGRDGADGLLEMRKAGARDRC